MSLTNYIIYHEFDNTFNGIKPMDRVNFIARGRQVTGTAKFCRPNYIKCSIDGVRSVVITVSYKNYISHESRHLPITSDRLLTPEERAARERFLKSPANIEQLRRARLSRKTHA